MLYRLCSITLILLTFFGCRSDEETYHSNLDSVAEDYVKLVLAIGEYDQDFIDA